MKNIRREQNAIPKIWCFWKYDFFQCEAVIKSRPPKIFFSKIVILLVLEGQIDENPTSHRLILIKFDMHTPGCVSYSRRSWESSFLSFCFFCVFFLISYDHTSSLSGLIFFSERMFGQQLCGREKLGWRYGFLSFFWFGEKLRGGNRELGTFQFFSFFTQG